MTFLTAAVAEDTALPVWLAFLGGGKEGSGDANASCFKFLPRSLGI